MLKIKSVDVQGIAAHVGLAAGDEIVYLNQQPARDIIDYYYHIAGERVIIQANTAQGMVEIDVEKDYMEDLGLEFDMQARRCDNNCIFCFVDQQPPGLRNTLYVKDDDYRLSFLDGNYITLTNLSSGDAQRIIQEKISPLHISIHATNPHIRKTMLGSKRDFDLLATLKLLCANGISIHGQIVLCPGHNDGAVLRHTLQDLFGLEQMLLSLAVVPVGLTKYRQHLPVLRPVDRDIATDVISIIDQFQIKFLQQTGQRVIYAADEFYVKAELPVPPEEYYEDFPQLENGIGLLRKALMQTEQIANWTPLPKRQRGLLLTGKAAHPVLKNIASQLELVFPELELTVHSMENHFLGPEITVAGLIAGQDVLKYGQSYAGNWDFILVPGASVRFGCFIDDYSLDDLQHRLDKPVHAPEDIIELAELVRNEVL